MENNQKSMSNQAESSTSNLEWMLKYQKRGRPVFIAIIGLSPLSSLIVQLFLCLIECLRKKDRKPPRPPFEKEAVKPWLEVGLSNNKLNSDTKVEKEISKEN